MIKRGLTRAQDRTGPTCHAVAMLRWLMAVAAIAVAALGAGSPAVASSTVAKPRIVWDPVPFGATRKAQMTAYARRHYGSFMKTTWRVAHPPVIIIHSTAESH